MRCHNSLVTRVKVVSRGEELFLEEARAGEAEHGVR